MFDLFAHCVVCASPPRFLEEVACPLCRVPLCVGCAMRHYADRLLRGDESLCRQMESYAAMHAEMRMDTPEYRERWRIAPVVTPTTEDFAAAHAAFSPALRRLP